jgi:hypothetical protein
MVHTGTEQGIIMDAGKIHDSEAVLMGGSLAETIAGIGAAVLAILGLVGILSEALLAVAVIAIGSAFVLESRSIASRFNVLMREMQRTGFETGEMTIGMTTEFVGGIAGITLGVLSLLGLVPNVLLPVAAVVFGVTLLFGVSAQSKLNEIEMECNTTHEMVRKVGREALSVASDVRVLLGIGVVTLGILSLVGIVAPVILTLVAMLVVGGAMLFSGAAVSARILGFTRYCEQPEHLTTS